MNINIILERVINGGTLFTLLYRSLIKKKSTKILTLRILKKNIFLRL